MRDDFPQADGQHGEGFVQAERVAQILRDFEQSLHFLARGGDGGEEIDCAVVALPASVGAGLDAIRSPPREPRRVRF